MKLLARLESIGDWVAARLRWLPPLVARVTLGWVFIESGWGKLNGLPPVVEYFARLGIPRPELQAPFAAGTELVCGVLLLLGLFTRFAAMPLIVVMVVAIATAKKDKLGGVSDLFGFIEYLYIALCLYLAVEGPGALSLDAWLARRRGARAGARAAGRA